ncbi:hypothetical protein ACRRTK_004918 [Alexandromys fortis]
MSDTVAKTNLQTLVSFGERSQEPTEAIAAGIFNDLGSGSNIDLCVISSKSKLDFLRHYSVPNKKGTRFGQYRREKGTTAVLTEKVTTLEIESPKLPTQAQIPIQTRLTSEAIIKQQQNTHSFRLRIAPFRFCAQTRDSLRADIAPSRPEPGALRSGQVREDPGRRPRHGAAAAAASSGRWGPKEIGTMLPSRGSGGAE